MTWRSSHTYGGIMVRLVLTSAILVGILLASSIAPLSMATEAPELVNVGSSFIRRVMLRVP
jgi:hypothetical protein